MTAKTTDAVRTDFIEKIGMITQGEGLPRTAGRVFGTLVFDGAALAFGDLAARLQVSRGSISSSVRLLEERGLIKRTSRPGDRQDYFQLAPNPYASLLAGAKKRTAAAHDEIAATIDDLPDDAGDIRDRLADYADFYRLIDDSFASALDELNERSTKSAGHTPWAEGMNK